MPSSTPPTLDPVAARRWASHVPGRSPWLHEEIGKRMAERLEWIRLQPSSWADWDIRRGGQEAHELVRQRYAKAESWNAGLDTRRAAPSWWRRWRGPAVHQGIPPDSGVQMVWANMLLHMSSEPQELMARWHRALAPQGFLMFSCFGPDTLRELREVYRRAGWPPPAHDFTDMHDWGDMLVHAGFAEPVMDMERITLTWADPAALLAELRGLGTNLSRERFGALRGRGWHDRLQAALREGVAQPDGRLALTFEVVYGHAMKPEPVVRMSEHSAVALGDMRRMLRTPRK